MNATFKTKIHSDAPQSLSTPDIHGTFVPFDDTLAMAAIIEASPSMIFRIENGIVTFANTAARMTVHDAGGERITGRPMADFVHPDYARFSMARTKVSPNWPG